MRNTLHQPYGPGKFEGESCIARIAYDWAMTGAATQGDCDCEDDLREANDGEYEEDWECAPVCASRVDTIYGPFTMKDVEDFESGPPFYYVPRMRRLAPMCQECVDTLLKLDKVEVTVSDQGFVHASA